MKIVGAWSGHDCSFCILENGYPVIHAEYERYIREKEPPGDSLKFLYNIYKDYSDIKYFSTCYPRSKIEAYPESLKQIKQIVSSNKGSDFYIGHHQAHAANVFFSSSFNDALIITIDGGGIEDDYNSATACTIWKGHGNKIECLKTYSLRHINIGSLWTRSTRYIFQLQSGWPRGHQAGSVMAQAALGDPVKYFNDFYRMLTKDIISAGKKPRNQPKGANTGNDPIHPYLDKWVKLAKNEQTKYDIAAGLQNATEVLIGKIIKKGLSLYSGSKNICLSGGVALNSVAMGKILNNFEQFDKINISPTSHDGGLTIGSSQYVWHHILNNPRIKWEDNASPYLGIQYTNNDILNDIDKVKDKINVVNSNDKEIINLLDQQNIIAVFGGGSESGRRALGNRSILADPRSLKMKDLVNSKVKHRQWYRPFAPSILKEEVQNWFKKDIDSPYMSFVVKFKDNAKDKVPAVIHFDGTARLQTVTQNDNLWYYNFLKQWQNKTGVPILLNTSFNDREPICEIAEHALNCFLNTNIDYLYFYDEKLLISKKAKDEN